MDITAELFDANGLRISRRQDDKPLTFKVSGAATLAGVGNGDPVALESFQSGKRSTYYGRVVGVVRASKIPVNGTGHRVRGYLRECSLQ